MNTDDDCVVIRIPLKGPLFKGKGEARKLLTELENLCEIHERRMREFVRAFQANEPKPRQYTIIYQRGMDQRRLRWRQSGSRTQSRFIALFDSEEGREYIKKLPRYRRLTMSQYELERIQLNVAMGIMAHTMRETRRYLDEMRSLNRVTGDDTER